MDIPQKTPYFPPQLLWASKLFFWAGLICVLGAGLFSLSVTYAVQVDRVLFPDYARDIFLYLLIIFGIASAALWCCAVAKVVLRARHVHGAHTGVAVVLLILLPLPTAIYYHFVR